MESKRINNCDEFHNNWEEMIFESEKELAKLFNSDDNINDKIEITDEKLILPLEKTEKETIVKVRKGQSFFRKTVLSSYNNCCCITGNPVSELLVASHIIPWAKSPENRLNPKNGLCLARTHDSAFDQGLISFDQDYKLMISPYLESFLPNKTLETNFFIYKNQQINLPNKFKPDEQFLSFHRENIFRH